MWQARIAREQAPTSAAVEEFTEDIFRANSLEQADPVKARQTTARQLLDLGARKVAGKLNDAPAAKLRMLAILGSLYLDLGLEDQAVVWESSASRWPRQCMEGAAHWLFRHLIDLGLRCTRPIR